MMRTCEANMFRLRNRSSCFAFDCVAPKFSPPVFAGLKQSASRHPLVGDPELWRCDQKPGRAGAYAEGKKFLHIEIFLKVSDISQGQHIVVGDRWDCGCWTLGKLCLAAWWPLFRLVHVTCNDVQCPFFKSEDCVWHPKLIFWPTGTVNVFTRHEYDDFCEWSWVRSHPWVSQETFIPWPADELAPFHWEFFLGLTRTPAAPLQNRALANGQNGHGGWRQKERAFSSKRMTWPHFLLAGFLDPPTEHCMHDEDYPLPCSFGIMMLQFLWDNDLAWCKFSNQNSQYGKMPQERADGSESFEWVIWKLPFHNQQVVPIV